MLQFDSTQEYCTILEHTEKILRGETSMNLFSRSLWNWACESDKPARIIYDGLDPYLLRVYLEARPRTGTGFWLHYFFRGDKDRELHNHPFEGVSPLFKWNMSLILTGGYVEERLTKTGQVRRRSFLPGSLNFIARNTFHKVTLRKPEAGCWSLFITGPHVDKPRGEDWGFLDPITGRYTPWGRYVTQRPVAPSE